MLSMNNALLWITVANVLYLASYSVHDILWLRILSVIAATLLIPYYMIQPCHLPLPSLGMQFLSPLTCIG
jgi:hypothetical protein